MAHKGKWARICGVQKNQECFNCTRRQEIKETKTEFIVSCDIGHGTRTLKFSRNQSPYCVAWKNSK